MSRIFVHGWGAVSPAGWGAGTLARAVEEGTTLPVQSLARPGRERPLPVRRVPAPECRPAFLAHPRLRRTSPISHFAVGAAIEALGADAAKVAAGERRLGIIFCAFTGCVGYSRRFYDEVLREPATASPLIFPETVFNAPASHLAAFFGSPAVNYTLVGDQGEFLKGVALAAEWLLADQVDGCLVVGAEEADWLSAEALGLLDPCAVAAEGAGAVYLRRESSQVELVAVTRPQLHLEPGGRAAALAATRLRWQSLAPAGNLVVVDRGGRPGAPATVRCPREVLGEGLGTGGAWQAVFGATRLAAGAADAAVVEVSGGNEQSVAAVFRRAQPISTFPHRRQSGSVAGCE